MSRHQPALRLVQRAGRNVSSLQQRDLCLRPSQTHLRDARPFSTTARVNATPTIYTETKTAKPNLKTSASQASFPTLGEGLRAKPEQLKLTPAQRAAAAAKKAREKIKDAEEAAMGSQKLGGLAGNSLFADDQLDQIANAGKALDSQQVVTTPLAKRSYESMAPALNPQPDARARWQRKMVIREIQQSGRLTKEVRLARTERVHLSRSHFFKTSMKKLAPLARQIAGKSVDEAILQMRFSAKKVAQDVRKHLIQARDEAIVMKGMGLRPVEPASEPDQVDSTSAGDSLQEAANKFASGETSQASETDATRPLRLDPGISPPLPHQMPSKKLKDGYEKHETDMYVAEAWTNRGPYGQEPDYRARGQLYIMRPPSTGLTVVLKEEKTRARIMQEREEKVIRKRLGKQMWTQLPDRKVTRQSQYLLW